MQTSCNLSTTFSLHIVSSKYDTNVINIHQQHPSYKENPFIIHKNPQKSSKSLHNVTNLKIFLELVSELLSQIYREIEFSEIKTTNHTRRLTSFFKALRPFHSKDLDPFKHQSSLHHKFIHTLRCLFTNLSARIFCKQFFSSFTLKFKIITLSVSSTKKTFLSI